MKTITLLGTITTITLLLFTNCKKSNSSTDEKKNRIKEISNSIESKTFLYDNDDRVTRINSSAGYSIRFTYSSTEIIAQAYFSNDQPDPQGKYSFTISNGLISSARKYLPNGAVVHEYGYYYDNQQRLSTVAFALKDFTGADSENHYYWLTYDAQNNLQQIAYKRSVDGDKADSASVVFTSFTDKSFITWENMGFDFFGKAAVGHQLQGQVPIPFVLVENIHPAEKAVKTIDTKKYQWNAGPSNWSLQSSGNVSRTGSEYQYNELGCYMEIVRASCRERV